LAVVNPSFCVSADAVEFFLASLFNFVVCNVLSYLLM
jgi:hypothetical protein